MDVEKLKKLAGSVRMGGKGTMRRCVHSEPSARADSGRFSRDGGVSSAGFGAVRAGRTPRRDVDARRARPRRRARLARRSGTLASRLGPRPPAGERPLPKRPTSRPLAPLALGARRDRWRFSVPPLTRAPLAFLPRRKHKAVHKTTSTDDKRLQSTLKRLGVNVIPGIEEVNIFKDDTVIHFTNPKVQASIAANTYVVSGPSQTKKLQDLLPGIINQLGPDNLEHLKKLAAQYGADGDDVPAVENFEAGK